MTRLPRVGTPGPPGGRGHGGAIALILALLAAGGGVARAAPGVDATAHFRTQLGTERLSALVLSPVEPRYRWLVGLLYSYGRSPLRGEHAGLLGTRNLISDQHLAEVRVLVGLPWAEAGFALPVVINQEGEPWTDADGQPHRSVTPYALGDLRLHAKGMFLDPRRYGVGLALLASLTTPTGQVARYAGSPGVVLDARLVLDVWISRTATFALNVGYTFRSAQERLADIRIDDALFLGLGFLFSLNDLGLPLHLWAEVVAASQTSDLFRTTETSPVEGRFGVRFWNSQRFFVDIGWGVAIVRGAGLPVYRVLVDLGFTFDTPGLDTPPAVESDRDGDGIPDANDRCPDQAEDYDGFEDADGCPEAGGPYVPEVDRDRYHRGGPTPWWKRWRWKQARDRAREPKPRETPRRRAAPRPAPRRVATPPRREGPATPRARLPDLSPQTRSIRASAARLSKTIGRLRRRIKRTKRAWKGAVQGVKQALPRTAPRPPAPRPPTHRRPAPRRAAPRRP